MARPAAWEPKALVTLVRCLTVAKVLSMGQGDARRNLDVIQTPPAEAPRLRGGPSRPRRRVYPGLRWKPGPSLRRRPRRSQADQAAGAKVVQSWSAPPIPPAAWPASQRVGRRRRGGPGGGAEGGAA